MNLQEQKIESVLKFADPIISNILDRAIAEKEISTKDALELFDAKITPKNKFSHVFCRDL